MFRSHRDVLTQALAARRLTRLSMSAALAAVMATSAASAAYAAAATPGLGANAADAERALREHAMKTLDGRSMSLGELSGQVVIVNFWASWCAPCRRELPRLARLESELAGARVRVLAVSIDEQADNARRFLRAQGVSLPVVHDGPEGLAKSLDLRSVPLTLVLDRAGHVAYTTSRSDAHALDAVAAEARRLAAAPAPSRGDGPLAAPAAGDAR